MKARGGSRSETAMTLSRINSLLHRNNGRIQRLEGPPVIILGGYENALSIARSLGSRGVRVWALAKPGWPVRLSRHAEWIRLPGLPQDFWRTHDFWQACVQFLTGRESDHLKGAVLLAASDEALEILIDHRPTLQERFRLDRSNPVAQRCLLDKITTYEAAKEAGVPTPRFWILRTRSDLAQIADQLVYPLLVKPRLSHLFWPLFQEAKFITAHTFRDVEDALDVVAEAGVEVFLVEKIPGPDNLLCSYYTYLDQNGRALFDYTKRIIRRHPKNMGQGTYHITDHVPGLKDRSLRLLRHVGLQGVANVEYKEDPRDGEYKLIECNARFTAATSLLAASGLDLTEFVYRQVVGLPTVGFADFRDGVRLWDSQLDRKAYQELRELDELTFGQWLRSVLHRQTFRFFSWRDPAPTVVPWFRHWSTQIVRLPRRVARKGLKIARLTMHILPRKNN